ncbi:MAG: YbjQ family protein, partial [Micromonosporaceae bacterium]
VLIVTTNEVPGHRITGVHGDVFGVIVRARNYFSNLGAQFRTLAGGEVAGYTRLLIDSRNQARERMWLEARARGANAGVAMRFDCNEIGDIMSEVVAYGTAVTVEPIEAAVGAELAGRQAGGTAGP